jgi:hypothetical protein
MEDAHTAELDIDGKKSAFFGVFDGLYFIHFFDRLISNLIRGLQGMPVLT